MGDCTNSPWRGRPFTATGGLFALWAVLWLSIGIARAELNAGGGTASANGITVNATLGELAAPVQSDGQTTLVKSGFAGQIYQVSTLQLKATPNVIQPGGTSQLSAWAAMDDTSVIVLQPTEVIWGVATYPIQTLTTNGLVTAALAASTTKATATGWYQGVTGAVSLVITPNSTQPPVASNLVLNIWANTPQLVSLAGFDPQGLALTYKLMSQPAHGTLGGMTNNQLAYAPAANFIGADQFTFVVANGLATSAVATVTLNVAKRDQALAFEPLANRVFGDPPFALRASASSALPVTFTVVSGPAKLASNLLSLTGTGTVTVRASQPGNTNFNAALSVERSFQVLPVTGTCVSIRRFPGTNVVKIGLSQLATPGNNPKSIVSFDSPGRNGGTLTRDGTGLFYQPAGAYTPDSFLCITRAANGNPVTNTVSVTVIDSLPLNTLRMLTENGERVIGFFAAPGLLWAIESCTNLNAGWKLLGMATETAPGVYVLRDTATLRDPFCLYRARQTTLREQTISLAALADRVLGDPPFPLIATASSGLPVSLSVVSGQAVLSDRMLSLAGTGLVTIRARQPGNTEYQPAPTLEFTFRVLPAVGQLITFWRFPGPNYVKLSAQRLAGTGSTLIASDISGHNGGSVTLESGLIRFTPSSSLGSDFFNFTVRNTTGILATNTATINVLTEMAPRRLYLLPENGDCVVGFAGNTGQAYQLQKTINPAAGWEVLGALIESHPGVYQWRDSAPPDAWRFYRILAPTD